MTIFNDIMDLVEYTAYSGYIAIHCPFPDHPDNSPSMAVYEDEDKPEDKRWFHCLGCDRKGTHQYLWKVLTGKGASVSLPNGKKEKKFLPQWQRWEDKYGSIENLVQKAHDNVTLHPATHAWYLKKRDLMPVYEKCLLGYMDEWLFFPIFDPQGKVVDVIVRDSKGRSKYVIHPNNEETPLLYVPNWKRVMESKLVYIVYGLIDALALEMCELPVITGSTGKSLSDKRLIQLNKEYVIIPDKGEYMAARTLAKNLGHCTHIIKLPFEDDTKDCDDIRMKHGLDYLKNLLTNL